MAAATAPLSARPPVRRAARRGATPLSAPLVRRTTRCAASTSPPTPPPPLRAWPTPRSWNAVALSKLLDTVEDVALITRRTLSPTYSTSLRAEAAPDGAAGLDLRSTRPVVLILGSGWAAHSMMKVLDTDAFEVVVASPRNHFLFTPMLPRHGAARGATRAELCVPSCSKQAVLAH